MDATRKSPSPEAPSRLPASDPLGRLARALADAGVDGRTQLVLAYSGGLDSSALLHALCLLRPALGFGLTAAHVDHGLQPESGRWAAHCAAVAARAGVGFQALAVRVDPAAGGTEAAARTARYAALAEVPGDFLLLAHHRDDQAETVMLALLRGAGPAGLAAMGADAVPPGHPCGRRLLRPWLDLDRASVHQWALQQGLRWIEDPSNQDHRPDRNYLRHALGPLLQPRFPGWRAALARSAQWAAEAQHLLGQLAEIDLDALASAALPDPAPKADPALPPDPAPRADPALLPGDSQAWRALPAPRARNLLRHLLGRRGVPAPPAARLESWMQQLGAAPDRIPELVWGDWVLRRWSSRLWLEPRLATAMWPVALHWPGDAPAEFPLADGSRLAFAAVPAAAPAPELILRADCGPLRIGALCGSDSLRLHPGGPHRPVRKLFQEAGVPPWRRLRLPGLHGPDGLVAVPGLAVAVESRAAAGSPGWRILWQDAAGGKSAR